MFILLNKLYLIDYIKNTEFSKYTKVLSTTIQFSSSLILYNFVTNEKSGLNLYNVATSFRIYCNVKKYVARTATAKKSPADLEKIHK